LNQNSVDGELIAVKSRSKGYQQTSRGNLAADLERSTCENACVLPSLARKANFSAPMKESRNPFCTAVDHHGLNNLGQWRDISYYALPIQLIFSELTQQRLTSLKPKCNRCATGDLGNR